jgi:hypothetical protein
MRYECFDLFCIVRDFEFCFVVQSAADARAGHSKEARHQSSGRERKKVSLSQLKRGVFFEGRGDDGIGINFRVISSQGKSESSETVDQLVCGIGTRCQILEAKATARISWLWYHLSIGGF